MATTLKWLPRDLEEHYTPLNSGLPNYSKDEITYELNSDDYRSDEFDKKTELPILFMGCSLTEGIGLPLNEVWTYHLHSKIAETTGKVIPFWSLAKGGTGIDYAARCFYKYGPLLKPKYVFYLLSSTHRREYEYCLDTAEYRMWLPSDTPDNSFSMFADPKFSAYQAYRSLMILNSVASSTGTTIFIFNPFPETSPKGIFEQFSNIEYIPKFVQSALPLPAQPSYGLPDRLKSRPWLARDNMHPGARWQYQIYNIMWNYVKDKFS